MNANWPGGTPMFDANPTARNCRAISFVPRLSRLSPFILFELGTNRIRGQARDSEKQIPAFGENDDGV
jgi:hypothetical protein